MREFRFGWREEEGIEVLELSGAIDSRSSVLFNAVMEALARQSDRDLRVDCGGITFLPSASVGQIVMLVTERRAAGRRVELVSLPDHLIELFRRMRLESFLGSARTGAKKP